MTNSNYKLQYFYIIFFSIAFLFSGYKRSLAQCKDSNGIFKCAKVFNDDKVAYLNDFKLSQKGSTLKRENGQEWEVYLLKGVKYRFALCCYDGIEKIVLKLYDKVNTTEDNPLNSTFKNGEDQAYFDFSPNESQVFYVSLRAKNGPETIDKICAIGLLGYIDKNHD